MTANRTDVLIVGAGPAGLTLAAMLAEHGVSFRIVDAKDGPVPQSRAAILHVRTLELLDRLGLAGRAVEQGVKTTRVEICHQGRRLGGFPLAGAGAEGFTPFPFALGLTQDRTEAILVDRLAERGRQIEWNTQLVELTGTAAVLRRNGGTQRVAARWVIGADGARSAVRHAVGVGFAGSTYDQAGLLADVDIEFPAGGQPADGTIRLNLTAGGFVGMFRLSNGRYRIFGALPPGLAPRGPQAAVSHEPYAEVPLGDVQRWFDEYFAVPARLTRAAWTAIFHIHSRIADRFRTGPVFLIGDAAHIHSPAGGQGMNLAIGDAVNLGWKLALVATGRAHERLLDSYEPERRPVATAVLRAADRGFALETTRHPVAVWVRSHLASRLIGPVTRLRVVRTAVYRLFSQTWITYHGSPAVAGRMDGRGPRPGDRAPYGRLEGRASTVYELIGGTRHHLLLFEAGRPDPASRQAVDSLLDRYAVDINVHSVPSSERDLHARYGARRPKLVLIRPDGHIAYAGPPTDTRGLARHLDRFATHV